MRKHSLIASHGLGITLGGFAHLFVTVTIVHSLPYNHSRAALKFIRKQETQGTETSQYTEAAES